MLEKNTSNKALARSGATAVLLVLASCATVNHGVVRGVEGAPTKERGYAVGSFGCDSLRYFTNYHIFFRSQTREISGSVHISADGLMNTTLDWNEAAWKGVAFRYALPPGRYEFYGVRFFQNGYPSTSTLESKEDFSVPFEVRRDEATYLGEIKCYPVQGKNIFGSTVVAGAYYVFSDQSQRDVSVIKVKYPELSNQNPRIDVPKITSSVSRFIRPGPM